MFVPYTVNSQLTKQLRNAEDQLDKLTGYRLKIVERAGAKLEDLLTRSDPWAGMECGRKMCLLCKTKEHTNKNRAQDCTKRSCVYEMWCGVCKDREEKCLEEESLEKDEMRKRI